MFVWEFALLRNGRKIDFGKTFLFDWRKVEVDRVLLRGIWKVASPNVGIGKLLVFLRFGMFLQLSVHQGVVLTIFACCGFGKNRQLRVFLSDYFEMIFWVFNYFYFFYCLQETLQLRIAQLFESELIPEALLVQRGQLWKRHSFLLHAQNQVLYVLFGFLFFKTVFNELILFIGIN